MLPPADAAPRRQASPRRRPGYVAPPPRDWACRGRGCCAAVPHRFAVAFSRPCRWGGVGGGARRCWLLPGVIELPEDVVVARPSPAFVLLLFCGAACARGVRGAAAVGGRGAAVAGAAAAWTPDRHHCRGGRSFPGLPRRWIKRSACGMRSWGVLCGRPLGASSTSSVLSHTAVKSQDGGATTLRSCGDMGQPPYSCRCIGL